MVRTTAHVMLLVIVVAILVGCGLFARPLKGQAFVVAADGHAIRLAGLRVVLVRADSASQLLNLRLPAWKRACLAQKGVVDRLEWEVDKFRMLVRETQHVNADLARTIGHGAPELQVMIQEFADSAEICFDAYRQARTSYRQIADPAIVLRELGGVVAQTTTDAEGHFEVRVPHGGSYGIAAYPSSGSAVSDFRQVWMIRLDDRAISAGRVLLTEANNVCSAVGSQSMIHEDTLIAAAAELPQEAAQLGVILNPRHELMGRIGRALAESAPASRRR